MARTGAFPTVDKAADMARACEVRLDRSIGQLTLTADYNRLRFPPSAHTGVGASMYRRTNEVFFAHRVTKKIRASAVGARGSTDGALYLSINRAPLAASDAAASLLSPECGMIRAPSADPTPSSQKRQASTPFAPVAVRPRRDTSCRAAPSSQAVDPSEKEFPNAGAIAQANGEKRRLRGILSSAAPHSGRRLIPGFRLSM